MNEQHEKYMKLCFDLALKGIGKVSPNPLVGAVIVKDGEIISQGYHKIFGGDHAEADAIKNANQDLSGAIMYCNLEPCCHTNKQTPPCVPLIINSKIAEVIISNVDPNPNVSGKGIEQLREAGINVVVGILAEEGKKLNEEFFSRFNK